MLHNNVTVGSVVVSAGRRSTEVGMCYSRESRLQKMLLLCADAEDGCCQRLVRDTDARFAGVAEQIFISSRQCVSTAVIASTLLYMTK